MHRLPNADERPTIPLWPDAGRALGIGRSSAYAAALRGEIPVIRLGGRVLVPTAALRRMLALDGPAEATDVLALVGGGPDVPAA